jgi:hypothetical protein
MSRSVDRPRRVLLCVRSCRVPRRAGVAAAVLLAVSLLPQPAAAVSVRDLVALSEAGLSDDILIALVEADATDFALDAPRILELRERGISEQVILAMLKVSRERRAESPVPTETSSPPELLSDEGAPSLVIIGESAPPPPPVREVILVPWFAIGPGPSRPSGPFMAPEQRGFGRFMNDGWVDRTTPNPR